MDQFSLKKLGVLLAGLFVVLPLLGGEGDPSAAASAAAPETSRFGPPLSAPFLEGLPAPFLMSPQRKSYYSCHRLIYNPVTNRTILFFWESTSSRHAILSRQFSAAGKAVGGPQLIFEEAPHSIGGISIDYNALNNTFLIIGTNIDKDKISAGILDGYGRLLEGQSGFITVKPETGKNTAMGLQAVWIEGTNDFVVQWTCSIANDPTNIRNGQYLAVVNSNLEIVLKPRKVRRQTMSRSHGARILSLGDKLVWAGGDDAPNDMTRPAVWFTDLKGKILTGYGANGFLYPGGPIIGPSIGTPVLDPVHNIVLLTWNHTDNITNLLKRTWNENVFRMMNTKGAFTTPAMVMPRKQPFQFPMKAVFVPDEARFFLICSEYQVYYQSSPQLTMYGGKFWGYYMDEKGRLQDKKGNLVIAPVALTKVHKDTTSWIDYTNHIYHPLQKNYLIAYHQTYLNQPYWPIWGMIYK